MEAVNDYIRTKNENVVLQKSVEFKEQQKTYLIIIVVLSVLSAFVVYWRYRVKHAMNKQLSELNAMKDLFFGIIAHDLKNPFLSILGATDLLLKDIDNMSNHEVKSVVQMIDSSGRQTYKLLENLLYWSLSQTGKIRYNPESINLAELVNDTIALHASSADTKNIKLNYNTQEEVVASCDAEMIRLVLRNLVSNGIKYTREGGEVSIILEKKENSVTVSVEDNGIGMPADYSEHLSSIGERLTTPGTRGEKGTGLGLILCRDFIHRNRGEFKIESREGNGSRFVFTLPAFE
jgi:signal transduction histidine kinase